MAQQQTIEINMARFENSPWGFRLHGGADFSSPLTIQKVRHSYFILLHIIHKNDKSYTDIILFYEYVLLDH